MGEFWKENENDNEISMMLRDGTLGMRESEIQRYEEMVYNKDAEITALKKNLQEMAMQMRDPNMYKDNRGHPQVNILMDELDKYKTLLKETEDGEKDLFDALKEAKMVIREREGEIKKLKEFIKTQGDQSASNLVEVKKKIDLRIEECNRLNHAKDSLQRTIKEKDERMEELRLSLWETQNYCERESKRLKTANEENVVKKERELTELKRTFEAEKKRFEQEVFKLRQSSASREDELQQIRKAAANFQDAIKIDEATINQLNTEIEGKDYEIFNMQQALKSKSDHHEKVKLELERKVFSLEKDLENVQERCEVVLHEKESKIETLSNAVVKEQGKTTKEMRHKDHCIEDLRRQVTKLQKECQATKNELQTANDKKANAETLSNQLNETMIMLQEQNENLRGMIDSMQVDNEKTAQEMFTLQEKFQETKEELSVFKDSKSQIEKLSKESTEKDVQIAVLQRNVTELKHVLENMKGNASLLSSKLDAKTKSLLKASKTLEELENEKKNHQEEIVVLKKDLEDISKKNDNTEMLLKDLKDIEAQKGKDYESMKEKLRELESLLNQKDNELKIFQEKLKTSATVFHSEEQKWQLMCQNNEEIIGKQKDKLAKNEKEINSLRMIAKEKENLIITLENMLKESKKNEHNFEISVQKLTLALEEEKHEHTKCKNEVKEFFEKYSLALAELKTLEETHKHEMEDVKNYYGAVFNDKDEENTNIKELLTKTEKSKDEELNMLKQQLTEFEAAKKSDMNSKVLAIENLKKSFTEASKLHEKKLGEIKQSFEVEISKKDKEVKELKKAVAHVKKLLENKQRELALENEAHELISQKYTEDFKIMKESKAESLRKSEQEMDELKKTLKNKVEEKEYEIKKIIDSSNEALSKKEEIISGFKQFIQETAAKSKNALNEKDEVIKRLKEHIDTLNSEISSKVQYVNSKEDEIKKLKADHQYGFSVLVKKCSDMEEKLIKSEETRLNLDEQSKNFLRDLQVKLKQKDVMFQRTQNELNTARDTNRKLTEQLEGATQRSKKQELLAKEAGKIIQNITDEKDNTVIKLKESNELCDKMQKLLMEKDSIVTSLKKEKVSLTEQIRNLYHQSSKLQDKLELKKKKIEEFEHNMKRLKTFVVELQQKNNKAGQLNFTIRERLEWMNKANDGNEKLMKDLKLANKTSNDQKNALSRKLAYQENQIRSQEKRLKELKQSLAQRKASIVELERNVRDLKSRKEELENDTFVLKNRLQESEQSNLTLQSALNELKVKENNLLLQTQDFERCKGEEINTLKKEIEGLRFYLSQSEDIIASITKERDTLIQDLEKTVQTHKDVNQTIESYNKCLTNDKTALEIKLKDLENVLLERNNEIGDLKNVLSSAETSHCYLTEQVAELNSLKLDMEKKKEEINSLKEQLKEMERASEKEMQEGRKKMKKSEEVFTRLRDDYQKLESVLREKESELRESHNTNNKIILENEELKELLNKTCHINKQLDMTLLGYKENADRHESSLAQLKTDNEFLKEFAKDTEKAKLKLDSLEESLQKKTTELKDLNDKLLAETKQSSTLREELNKQESTCNKLKDRYETRIKTSAREVDELRTMLDEKNKEISVIKMEKNSCEMKQREAEFKVLELTNSLRDETAYEQNITQRNKELEIELRKIQYEKRLGLVSSSVDAAQILREIPQTDIATERRLQQKVDNIALDKIRNLHTKASNLEVQLEQERHDRVKEHAEVARLKAELAVYKSLQ